MDKEKILNDLRVIIMDIYGIPKEVRYEKIQKVFTMDYQKLGMQVLAEFKEYVEQANEQAFLDLLRH